MKTLIKKEFLTAASLLVMMLAPSPSLAQDYISLGIGYYDILDDEGAADFRIEYRPDTTFFEAIQDLKPWGGVEVTSEASLWLGGGILYEYEFADQWHLIPSFGAGFYAKGSSDLDLGYPLEFRSQLEVSYEFESEHQIDVAFGHLSNASLDDDNPGTEVLNLYWHAPF